METEVVTVLQFKLLPDTLFFWLDLELRLWDLFVEEQKEAGKMDCARFKPITNPRAAFKSTHDPRLSSLKLGKPNTYRVICQALDLMSLHFVIHEFSRSKLTLGLLALV